MLEFLCLNCGKRVQANEPLAGEQVRCPVCNRASVTSQPTQTANGPQAKIPSSGAPSIDAGESPLPPPVRKELPGIVGRMVPGAIVIVLLLIVVALLVPAILKTREAANRSQSTNNLKNCGLSFQSFNDVLRRLPYNGTVPAKAWDSSTGAWAFQILPYLESSPFFNYPNTTTGFAVYMCPGRGRPYVSDTGMWSDYCINPWLNDRENGSESAFDHKFGLDSITDGTSSTILLGHGAIDPTMYSTTAPFAQSTDVLTGGKPATARRSTANQRDTPGDLTLKWGGPFERGSLICMADGTVRLFPYSSNYGDGITNGRASRPFAPGLGVLLTPAGAEGIDLKED